MQLNQALRSVVGKSVEGTFGLQLLLQDHATESTLAEIQRAANTLYQQHEQQHHVRLGTPVFEVIESRRRLALQIRVANTGDTVGAVPLHREGDQIIISKPPVRKRAKPLTHHQANYSLGSLRDALVAFKAALAPLALERLTSYLEYFEERRNEAFCFDLDVTNEGLTIVAYHAFQRFSTITLFY